MMIMDRLVNLITGMGGSRDKSAAGTFSERILSDAELEAMYRDDWIAKKIVRIPAYDMLRNGRVWNGADKADLIRLAAEDARLGLSAKLLKALIWSRLYGGAALIVEDGGSPEKELSAETFGEGGLKQVHVASRRRMTIPDGFETDIRAAHFGGPKMFGVTINRGMQIKVHPSRVIAVLGDLAPDTDIEADYWGDSVLRSVYDAVQHASRSASNFAQLTDEAKIDIVSIKNLAGQLADNVGATKTIERWALFGLNKSQNGIGLLDADAEEHKQKQVSFDGHDRLLMALMILICGAADIPATRMLGQSPKGLNATGESDLVNYYNALDGRRHTDVSPVMDRLDEFFIRSALGEKPPELWYDWRPLWTPTPMQSAALEKTVAETVKIYVETAAVNSYALGKGVESRLIDNGLLPGFEAALSEAAALEAKSLEILPGGGEEEEEDEPEEIEPADA